MYTKHLKFILCRMFGNIMQQSRSK